MHEDGTKFLAKKIGANLDQIEKINLKEDFTAKLKNGNVEHFDLDDLVPIVRSGCLACTDFSNYSADISVGGIGSPEGYTTTIVRNQAAQRLISLAIRQGYLEETDPKNALEMVERMAERKKSRGENVLTKRKAKMTV